MKKNIKFILISILLIALACVSLVGCTKVPKLTGGDPNATTYNNNSLVVSQGDYIYFVNGKISVDDIATKKDNKYGNVVKSAIYRAKKDGSDVQVLVPQVAMDSNNSNGISVLGNYVYFTSPSTTTGKDGTLQKTNTDFYRVEISGKNLKKIATIQGNTNQYKFTDKGLFYLLNNELVYVPYKGKKKVIAENVSNTYFPVTSTYVPGSSDASMAVYYTQSPEENDGNPYNDLKCVNADGEVKDIVSGKEDDISYSIKSVESEADGSVAVYYEKTPYDNGRNEVVGLFGIKVNKEFAKSADEKQFANKNATVRYISYNEGVYVFEYNKMYIPVIENGIAKEGSVVYKLYTSDSASIPSTDIFAIREENGKKFMYYFASNALLKVEMLADSLGMAEEIIEANIVTDYVKPVILGNTFYYINSGYYNYMYSFDLLAEGAKHSIVGVRTDADKAQYIKFVQDMDEDAKADHDKLIKEDLPAEEFKK